MRFLLCMVISTPLWACGCGGMGPDVKAAWQQAPAVFLGTVVAAEPDNAAMFERQVIHIRVDEAFKGVTKDQVIVLKEGGDSCAFKTSTGKRNVYYLRPVPDGDLGIEPCNRSIDSADPEGDALLFLRALPASANLTRVSGEVTYPAETAGWKGLAGAEVEIEDKGRQVQTVKTNGSGVYEIYGLAPGRYQIRLKMPVGYKLNLALPHWFGPEPGYINLSEKGSTGMDYLLKEDTLVSGHVMDLRGTPVEDLCVDLQRVGQTERVGRQFGCTKAGGRFQIEAAPAGTYLLKADDKVRVNGQTSKSTVYYPGVRDIRKAIPVSIDRGMAGADLTIHIPDGKERRVLSGRVLYADGKPVAEGSVRFSVAEMGYEDSGELKADGSFVISAEPSVTGVLKGSILLFDRDVKACPQFQPLPRMTGAFRQFETVPVELKTDQSYQGLELKLTIPSCDKVRVGRQ